jgi:hypothetical protein
MQPDPTRKKIATGRRSHKRRGLVCKVCGRPVARVARCRNQGGWRHVGPYTSDGHAPVPSGEQLAIAGTE